MIGWSSGPWRLNCGEPERRERAVDDLDQGLLVVTPNGQLRVTQPQDILPELFARIAV